MNYDPCSALLNLTPPASVLSTNFCGNLVFNEAGNLSIYERLYVLSCLQSSIIYTWPDYEPPVRNFMAVIRGITGSMNLMYTILWS